MRKRQSHSTVDAILCFELAARHQNQVRRVVLGCVRSWKCSNIALWMSWNARESALEVRPDSKARHSSSLEPMLGGELRRQISICEQVQARCSQSKVELWVRQLNSARRLASFRLKTCFVTFRLRIFARIS